jgi:fumarate reductase subunit C
MALTTQKTAVETVPAGRSYGAFFERNWGKIFLFTVFFAIVLYVVFVLYAVGSFANGFTSFLNTATVVDGTKKPAGSSDGPV